MAAVQDSHPPSWRHRHRFGHRHCLPGLGQTLKPIGDVFLNLLLTIVVPLVFVSIACAVDSMANMNRLGKILGGTVAVFLATGGLRRL